MKKAPAEIVKQPQSKPSVSSDSEAVKIYGKNEAVAIVKQIYSNLEDLCEYAPNDHFRRGLSYALSISKVMVKLCEHVPEEFWDDSKLEMFYWNFMATSSESSDTDFHGYLAQRMHKYCVKQKFIDVGMHQYDISKYIENMVLNSSDFNKYIENLLAIVQYSKVFFERVSVVSEPAMLEKFGKIDNRVKLLNVLSFKMVPPTLNLIELLLITIKGQNSSDLLDAVKNLDASAFTPLIAQAYCVLSYFDDCVKDNVSEEVNQVINDIQVPKWIDKSLSLLSKGISDLTKKDPNFDLEKLHKLFKVMIFAIPSIKFSEPAKNIERLVEDLPEDISSLKADDKRDLAEKLNNNFFDLFYTSMTIVPYSYLLSLDVLIKDEYKDLIESSLFSPERKTEITATELTSGSLQNLVEVAKEGPKGSGIKSLKVD